MKEDIEGTLSGASYWSDFVPQRETPVDAFWLARLARIEDKLDDILARQQRADVLADYDRLTRAFDRGR